MAPHRISAGRSRARQGAESPPPDPRERPCLPEALHAGTSATCRRAALCSLRSAPRSLATTLRRAHSGSPSTRRCLVRWSRSWLRHDSRRSIGGHSDDRPTAEGAAARAGTPPASSRITTGAFHAAGLRPRPPDQWVQSTAISRASQICDIRSPVRVPRRSTSTPTETLSTESRLTADRRGTGSSPGSRTTSLGMPRMVVVHGATSARPSRGIATSRDSTTTGRGPISGSSHHQSSPRRGRSVTTRRRPNETTRGRPTRRPRSEDARRRPSTTRRPQPDDVVR